MDKYELAFNEWHNKTNWVQDDKRFDVLLPWGKHRADVMKEYIDLLESRIADMAVQLANAESKCRELVAELSAVDKIHNEAVFITDDHYEQCPSEVQKMVRSLAVLQIPAYDAFLAEVRAQGVDLFALMFAEEAIKSNNITTGWRAKASRAASEYAEALREDAAQLRKGAAL